MNVFKSPFIYKFKYSPLLLKGAYPWNYFISIAAAVYMKSLG